MTVAPVCPELVTHYTNSLGAMLHQTLYGPSHEGNQPPIPKSLYGPGEKSLASKFFFSRPLSHSRRREFGMQSSEQPDLTRFEEIWRIAFPLSPHLQ